MVNRESWARMLAEGPMEGAERSRNLKLTDLAVAIVHHDFNPAVRKEPPPAPDQRD